ncbi:MAG: hypothetical protein IPL10_02350 [Bacteroidetes bacterium]|nr:hypothetical protein [Bacteroidota bacterium]
MNKDNEKKDISTGAELQNGINQLGLVNHTENLIEELNAPSKHLKKVIMTAEKIKSLKEREIVFANPLLLQNGKAVIFPNTINVIQGQAGVHKSRLAEFHCAAMLKLHSCSNELLGFKRDNFDASNTVVYVDTERNLTEQFPYALQSIQTKAGYHKSEHPHNFKYISLLEIPRKDRFSVLDEYLNLLKRETKNPLFIVLDVSTDCISDFNKIDASMELIDLMNVAINQHDVVFLCLIHENPKSEKARGHFGTELMNKSSTVIQVSYEKDSNNNDTDLIKVRYLKCRSTARHKPFYAKYSEEQRGLVLANPDEIQSVMNVRKQKADVGLVIEYLEMYLGDGTTMTRRELMDKLIVELGASEKTIEDRLKEIHQGKMKLQDENGKTCYLEKDKTTRELKYLLIPEAEELGAKDVI